MALPGWLQNNLNNEEMHRHNNDPDNRRSTCSDPEQFDRDVEEINRRNGRRPA